MNVLSRYDNKDEIDVMYRVDIAYTRMYSRLKAAHHMAVPSVVIQSLHVAAVGRQLLPGKAQSAIMSKLC